MLKARIIRACILSMTFACPAAAYADGLEAVMLAPENPASFLNSPQIFVLNNGVYSRFSPGELGDFIDGDSALMNAYRMAGVPVQLVSNHGHSPESVQRLHAVVPPTRRGFLHSSACGWRGSDGLTWSQLRPGTSVVATNPGYVTYSIDLSPDQNLTVFAEPGLLHRLTNGRYGNYKLAHPEQALGVYRNGVRVTNVSQPQRLMPEGSYYYTPDGYVAGTRRHLPNSPYLGDGRRNLVTPDRPPSLDRCRVSGLGPRRSSSFAPRLPSPHVAIPTAVATLAADGHTGDILNEAGYHEAYRRAVASGDSRLAAAVHSRAASWGYNVLDPNFAEHFRSRNQGYGNMLSQPANWFFGYSHTPESYLAYHDPDLPNRILSQIRRELF